MSKLPEHVGQRELIVVRDRLKWREDECAIETVQVAPGLKGIRLDTGGLRLRAPQIRIGHGQDHRPAGLLKLCCREAA
jgi:hypothetical protein